MSDITPIPGMTVTIDVNGGGIAADILNNPKYADGFTAKTAPQYANYLLFVSSDGKITPLRLGEGLEIIDGALTVTSIAVAKAICGEAVCGDITCGNT